MTATKALAEIWQGLGMPAGALGQVRLGGADPCLPSSFAVGTAASASIAAAGLAAAEIWRQRGGRAQTVSVEMRHACAEFRSEHYLTLDGKPTPARWDDIAGLYETSGGGWVRLHTNFPHHREGVLRLLGCAGDRAAVAAALASWEAVAFETAAAVAGLAVSALRSFAEWDAHPQSLAVPGMRLVSITRIGDAPVEALPPATRPLSGVRVLELVRVIAGPVCGRILAGHGADVMNITAAHLPSVQIEDVNRGKLSAQLDLRGAAGREGLAGLIRGADVFVQGYRPGAIAGLGFSPAQTQALRPGLIHATLSAYGPTGPWAGRHGFDSLVQTASGFNAAEAEAAGETTPRPLPCQALDHATGTLLAAGVMAALHRRAVEGGGWHVEVSLARTAHWLRGLGRVADGFAAAGPEAAEIAGYTEMSVTQFGVMGAISHAALLSETPARLSRPCVPLGTHAAVWHE